MKKEIFTNNLLAFIKKATCAFTGVEEIEKELQKQKFTLLEEQENWDTLPNTFYVKRNDSSIIAIKIKETKENSFHIITTHIDTPSLLLKPNGSYTSENYLQYNIMPYGGLLNYGWLDKNLSIAGRILIKKGEKWHSEIIDYKDTIAVIPSVAIHQNDAANSNLDLNMQTDLQPVFALSKETKTWESILQSLVKKNTKIGDYELFLYDNSDPVLFGPKKEFLLSPRIDNLTSVYASLESFLESESDNILVFCSFNSEEIGSLTKEGAESNFLLDILKKVAAALNLGITKTLASSWIISADNTHAIHPNHPEYADKTSNGIMGEGFAIVKEINSTTDAIFSTLLKDLCKEKKILYQDVTVKNDLAGGSTLSGLSLRHVSVSSIDVGIAELAMHSSKELCSIDDVYNLYLAMKIFYQTNIYQKEKSYWFKKKKNSK